MVDASYQVQVGKWLVACFGEDIANDKIERNHRFLEESLELVQSTGCTQSEAHQLVDYVFNRDVGEPMQEVGGVMTTLASLCRANDMNMHECGFTELRRVWGMMDKIRAKQAAKPKHSPLAEHTQIQRDMDPKLRDLIDARNLLASKLGEVKESGEDIMPLLGAISELTKSISEYSDGELNELHNNRDE